MSDKPMKPSFTVLDGGKGVVQGGDVVASADPVMSAREARAIVSDPNATLEMITQDVFDAFMKDEIQEQEEGQFESGESPLLDDKIIEEIGERCINHIVSYLSVANSSPHSTEEDMRAYLNGQLEEYLSNHQ